MRFRLYPTPEQEKRLLTYCAHARFVWNLCVEQNNCWRPGKSSAPNFLEHSRQLTEARASIDWLHEAPRVVQQQALRDYDLAMKNFFRGIKGRPTWRKEGRSEGFRICESWGDGVVIAQVSVRFSQVKIPLLGFVKFRQTLPLPEGLRSYRVKRDRAGRWFIGFPVRPTAIPAPQNGLLVGVDLGIVQSVTLSNGTAFCAPARSPKMAKLDRKLSRAQRGSRRRLRAKQRLAREYGRMSDRRRDFIEKTTTTIARGFDEIAVEDLKVAAMSRRGPGKRGLNREMNHQAWGKFLSRLEDKAEDRVVRVSPAFTSQRCSVCGHIAAESRKSQALFACVACGHSGNADVNAAKNIAAGYAVTARGGSGLPEPTNCEPVRMPNNTFNRPLSPFRR